jgi:hypothetical protein
LAEIRRDRIELRNDVRELQRDLRGYQLMRIAKAANRFSA